MVYSAAREGNVDESSLPVLSEEDFQALGVSACVRVRVYMCNVCVCVCVCHFVCIYHRTIAEVHDRS